MFDPEHSGIEQRLLACWGKTVAGSSDAGIFHPALFHMIDVGNVARVLLSAPASSRWQKMVAAALAMPVDDCARLVPYLVALHDLGKVSPAFQSKNNEQVGRLTQMGFTIGHPTDLPHPMIGQVFLGEKTLSVRLSNGLLVVLRDMVGGHHGRFVSTGDISEVRQRLRREEHPEWKDLRKHAESCLAKIFLPADPVEFSEPPDISTAVMTMTGFTILCDWIGSDERFFGPCAGWDLVTYQTESRRLAYAAVQSAGFFQPVISASPAGFTNLFLDIPHPRPLQSAIDLIPDSLLKHPCLAVIEAPTGEGKTEAALALARRIAILSGTDELYYALPTMATSNQMFLRLQKHLVKRLGLSQEVKLIHGQAHLIADDLQASYLTNGESGSSHIALEWFSSKKRALLAPFGVGTIDQAELGALNVPHVALRLVGLAGKVLIIDEVHAYDTYMSTIIEQLLRWLAALGTHVVLLSATLPKKRRDALAAAFGACDILPDDAGNAYPLLIVCGSGSVYYDTPAASQPDRVLQIPHIALSEDHDSRARWLLDQIADGGCACWITNTVERSQRLFEAVDRLAPRQVDRSLLHSQFPLDDRQDLERLLTLKYGPERSNRPAQGIVIGTQVLEQSLDVDFDLMVSDIAPVDLLLQRAGRLHRHHRLRPARHAIPRLWINAAEDGTGELEVGSDRYIYAEYILRKTWEVLRERETLHLPADYRPLIEAVYDAPVPVGDTTLAQAWQDLQIRESKAIEQALQRLLPAPNAEDSFANAAARLVFEENEDSAEWNVAQTRLAQESLSIIPLDRIGDLVTCPGMSAPVRLDRPAPRETQLQLLRRNMRVSRKDVVKALQQANSLLPKLFSESALLKGYMPLFLENGSAELRHGNKRFVLTLDSRLGLVIAKD